MNEIEHVTRLSITFDPFRVESKERILPNLLVVKCGTNNLSSKTGEIDQEIFNEYARQIDALIKCGVQVVLVSSGAVKTGRGVVGELGKKDADYTKPELASLGQDVLMGRWREAFKPYGRAVGQILATYANWEKREEKESIKKTILGLAKKGDITVINENDPVSDEEIVSMDKKISENDKMGEMIASLIDADCILFLTDEGGVFSEDPKKNPNAKLYEEINGSNLPTCLIDGFKNAFPNKEGGTGGIEKKLGAALRSWEQGLNVGIAGGGEFVIVGFAMGKPVGTKIGTVNKFFSA